MGHENPVPCVCPGQGRVATMTWSFGGRTHVSVIVKADYDLVANTVMRPREAEPVRNADAHQLPSVALIAPCELLPMLTAPEITFSGKAHPPAPTTKASVALSLVRGEATVWSKTLHVYGDRAQPADAPAVFAEMEIAYGRALGGVGAPNNPMGVGLGANARKQPNLSLPGDPAGVACFAPLPPAFEPRRARYGGVRAGTYRAAHADIPDGFDWLCLQAAPDDQWLDELEGSEWLMLDGLVAGARRLASQLPGHASHCRIYGADALGVPSSVPLGLQSIHVDGEALRCTLVWRGSFTLPAQASVAGIAVAAEVLAQGAASQLPGSFDEAQRLTGDDGSGVEWLDDDLLEDDELDGSGTLPADGAGPKRRNKSTVTIDVPPAPTDQPASKSVETADVVSERGGEALPFSGGAARPPSQPTPSAPIPGAPWAGESAPAVPEPTEAQATLALGNDAAGMITDPAALAILQQQRAKLAATAGTGTKKREKKKRETMLVPPTGDGTGTQFGGGASGGDPLPFAALIGKSPRPKQPAAAIPGAPWATDDTAETIPDPASDASSATLSLDKQLPDLDDPTVRAAIEAQRMSLGLAPRDDGANDEARAIAAAEEAEKKRAEAEAELARKAEEEARAAEEAAKAAAAKKEQEERAKAEAEAFRREQEEAARKEQERAAKLAAAERDAAAKLEDALYGGFDD